MELKNVIVLALNQESTEKDVALLAAAGVDASTITHAVGAWCGVTENSYIVAAEEFNRNKTKMNELLKATNQQAILKIDVNGDASLAYNSDDYNAHEMIGTFTRVAEDVATSQQGYTQVGDAYYIVA